MTILENLEYIEINFNILELFKLGNKEKIIEKVRKILEKKIIEGVVFHHCDGGEDNIFIFLHQEKLSYIYYNIIDCNDIVIKPLDDYDIIDLFEYTPLVYVLEDKIKEMEYKDYLYLQKGVNVKRLSLIENLDGIKQKDIWENKAQKFKPNSDVKKFLDENFIYYEI